eukprot:GHVO01014885.1.p1 GENE.GHVO01014885.1~~GHVO01014885.1.p1  ORF type:complete len:189 (-),score=5.05 GHVO01014885.1:260-826(-)
MFIYIYIYIYMYKCRLIGRLFRQTALSNSQAYIRPEYNMADILIIDTDFCSARSDVYNMYSSRMNRTYWTYWGGGEIHCTYWGGGISTAHIGGEHPLHILGGGDIHCTYWGGNIHFLSVTYLLHWVGILGCITSIFPRSFYGLSLRYYRLIDEHMQLMGLSFHILAFLPAWPVRLGSGVNICSSSVLR